MSALQKPSVTVGMQKGLSAGQAEPVHHVVRSDESIGRQEDIGRLAPPRPPKPIRVTIDLDPDRYRTLQAFRGKQITAAAVFRAFLDELEDSNELAARISARIWAAKR